jgi:hypothetical protein
MDVAQDEGGWCAHPVLVARTVAADVVPVTRPETDPFPVSGMSPLEVIRTGEAYTGTGISCWQLRNFGFSA